MASKCKFELAEEEDEVPPTSYEDVKPNITNNNGVTGKPGN
jgi:hypothetical protein